MLRVQTIVVPTDLSVRAEAAFTYAETLARRFGSEVHLIHVVPPGTPRDAPVDLHPLAAADVLDDLRVPEGPEPPVAIIQREIASANVPEAIEYYARVHQADVIVMGARGRNWLATPILGGVADHVVRHAHCPVLTVRERLPERGVTRILAPIDFSEPCRESLRVAGALAKLLDAELDVLHVVDGASGSAYTVSHGPRDRTASAVHWEDYLDGLLEQERVAGPRTTGYIRGGAVAPTIVNFALERQSELIVMGTHGASGVRRVLLGSVAEALVRRSPCPVLVIKPFGRRITKSAGSRRRRVLAQKSA
jgi:nucleotide-binding universal stress UspA family protein